MQLFKCQSCAQLLYFDNSQCMRCGHALGYISSQGDIFALDDIDGLWQPIGLDGRYRRCANARFEACNWMVSVDEGYDFCQACRYNRTIPNLVADNNLANWRKMERAKHHMFYSLLRLRLPLVNRLDNPRTGLAFDFLTDSTATGVGSRVLTGHDDGIITINLAEADDTVREQRRMAMSEPYRTLLGHFRHEIGHYYWDHLVENSRWLDECRRLFGDDTQDYGSALRSYYANGPRADWELNHVSAYATAHPWEDFAETWAHYLHIVDTLEMAGAFGLHLHPALDRDNTISADADRFDPYTQGSIAQMIDVWTPITITINSLNRCIGQPDFYPFVLSSTVIAKLGFIHDLVRGSAVFPVAPLETVSS